MSFKPDLDHLLGQFQNLVLLRDLALGDQPGVAIRHDIDHNLDAALELAWREHQLGIRATYYILHDASYMADPDRFRKIRAIQAFGHDVGLHTNFLAQWFQGRIDDVSAAIDAELVAFREAGVDVQSVAAHGDPDCYKAQFTNYWLWSELRPDTPWESEKAVNAEGRSLRADPEARTISYPKEVHGLVRADGSRYEFWGEALADHGLSFEASRVDVDHYYSDSGNRWWTGPPDLSAMNEKKRVQILIHPEHWRAAPRHIYLLSTARSGSSWIANLLGETSTAASRHEFTLNFDGENRGDVQTAKRTTFVPELQADRPHAASLIAASRAYTEGLGNDCVEANVYLPHFLDMVPHPEDTEFVHLHRRPQDVIRSILQRKWYEVPHDPKHPRMSVADWNQLEQFEQACWYVREVNETLLAHCDRRLDFARMVKDPVYLAEFFAELGVGIDQPRLASLHAQRRNETPEWDIPSDKDWPEAWHDSFARICGPICEALGYAYAAASGPAQPLASLEQRAQPAPPELIASLADWQEPGRLSWTRAEGRLSGKRFEFVAQHSESALLLLGGGYWRNSHVGLQSLDETTDIMASVAKSFSATGWEAVPLTVFALHLAMKPPTLEPGGLIRVFCLSYDARGELLEQKVLAIISGDTHSITCNFKPHRQAARFNLAVFKSPGSGAALTFEDFRLVAAAEDRRAAMSASSAVAAAGGALSSTEPPKILRGKLPAALPVGWNVQRIVTDARPEAGLADPTRAGHLVLFNGSWAKLDRDAAPDAPSLNVSVGDRVSGQVSLLAPPRTAVSLFALFYNSDGRLTYKIRLGRFGPSQSSVSFRFLAVAPTTVAIAIHLPPTTPPIALDSAVVDIESPDDAGDRPVRCVMCA